MSLFKKIGLIPNIKRDINLESTKELAIHINKLGLSVLVEESMHRAVGLDFVEASSDVFQDAEIFFVLGGDGTMLHAASKSAVYNKPIMGINLGYLGYLTDVDKNDACEAVSRVLSGDFHLEKRMMLCTEAEGRTLPLALNDVCVSRESYLRPVELDIYINSDYIDRYRCDGIIVSTPTGSTAYNLSAGGPILKPDAQMIAVTPICPHTLYARPFVVSSEDCVTIRTNARRGALLIDGQSRGMAADFSEITVKRSEYRTTIIKTNNMSFYDILRLKMVGRLPASKTENL